jgi:hypothetical protein
MRNRTKQKPHRLAPAGLLFEYWWRRRESPTSTIVDPKPLIRKDVSSSAAQKIVAIGGA